MHRLPLELLTVDYRLVKVTIHTLLIFERYRRAFSPHHTLHRSSASDQQPKYAARKQDWKSFTQASAQQTLSSKYRLKRHYLTPPTLNVC